MKSHTFLEKLVDEAKKQGTTLIDKKGETTIAISGPQLIFASMKVFHKQNPEAFKNIKKQNPPFKLTIEKPK